MVDERNNDARGTSAIGLMAGGMGKASAQGLVEYLVIIYQVNTSAGPVMRRVQTSSEFDKACETASGLAAACAAIDAIEAGMPGAEAMARLSRADGKLVASAAAIRPGRPLLIVAEDIEGEALAKHTRLRRPFRPIADVLFQATSDDGAVGLVGCDLSGEPLAAFVQEYPSDGENRFVRPQSDLDAETCANALQRQRLLSHELAHVVLQVTPVSRARGVPAAPAHIGSRGKPRPSKAIGVEEVVIVHEYVIRKP